jgi:hypothetical protein
MATQKLPGTDAARNGSGDADLTIMMAAHDALRRDLVRLVRAAAFADLPDPGRRASVQAGWETFKRQLHMHHTADGAPADQAAAAVRTLSAPVRLIYRAVWKPRFARTSRW